MNKIALAPANKNQLINYTNWLDKRNIPYKILKEGDTIEDCSMLMLCGGPDVGSAEKRDELETRWLKKAYGKMPVIGICRGLQISNVVLGGTLHEDLSDAIIKHTSNKKEIAGEPAHILESGWHDIVFNDGTKIRVNSRHHQGIKDLAPGLEPLAICEEDGLIEMTKGENALFVQWHPERPDVWGTDAEKIVYDWLKEHFNQSEYNPLEMIFEYMDRKGFTVVSNDRIRKSINSTFDDIFLSNLIKENSSMITKVTDKNGKTAIKKLK